MKPDLSNNPFYYKNPSIFTLTDTIVDAIDSATTNNNIYPYANTSVVSEDFAELVVRNNSSSNPTLTANYRIAYGVFLSALNDRKDIIFQVNGSFVTYRDASASIYPIIGRASSNSVVSSSSSVENLLSTYSILPYSSGSLGGSPNQSIASVSIDIYKRLDSSNTYPYFFGWVIEAGGALCTLATIVSSISVRAYSNEVDPYRPSRT